MSSKIVSADENDGGISGDEETPQESIEGTMAYDFAGGHEEEGSSHVSSPAGEKRNGGPPRRARTGSFDEAFPSRVASGGKRVASRNYNNNAATISANAAANCDRVTTLCIAGFKTVAQSDSPLKLVESLKHLFLRTQLTIAPIFFSKLTKL